MVILVLVLPQPHQNRPKNQVRTGKEDEQCQQSQSQSQKWAWKVKHAHQTHQIRVLKRMKTMMRMPRPWLKLLQSLLLPMQQKNRTDGSATVERPQKHQKTNSKQN